MPIPRPWRIEKSNSVLESLAYFIDKVRQMHANGEITDGARVTIEDYIGLMIGNSTKLFSEAMESDWTPNDPSLVMRRGVAGYKELSARYGFPRRIGELPEY